MKKLIASGCKKPDKTPGRIRHQYRSQGSSNVRAYRALQLLAFSASFSFFFLCLCFSGSSPRAMFIITPKIRPTGAERSGGHLQEAPAPVITAAAPGSAPPALPSTRCRGAAGGLGTAAHPAPASEPFRDMFEECCRMHQRALGSTVNPHQRWGPELAAWQG